uniref:Uncharacterized protein n=1 Tax=Rhizophora mucronata TaxID=61149 RepID=A0A2P2R0Z6_RHIMU
MKLSVWWRGIQATRLCMQHRHNEFPNESKGGKTKSRRRNPLYRKSSL